MEYKFKVGDRVIRNENGKAGTVIGIKESVASFLVEGLHTGFGMHNGMGFKLISGRYGDSMNCRWFCSDELTAAPLNKIVITSDGTTTLARLYDGKKVIKSAEAKCSPDDTYDFATGANLAYDRLMRLPEEPKKEESKYYSGKVVCVISGKGGLTKGKVYEVKNGYMTDDNKNQRPSLLNRPKSIDDDFLVDWFIEYKGEQA